MTLLKSPLAGYIFPRGTTVPAGTFVETSTLAEHIASGRAPGCDYGNKGCGAEVRLMLPGVCYQKYKQPMHNPPQMGDGALIARFRHADGGSTGYAHLQDFGAFVVGASYAAGFLIGHHGMTGATACHLHCDYKDASNTTHEVQTMLEQSRNLQFNAGVDGVRIRTGSGTAAPVWGYAGQGGIVRASDGKKVAELNTTLTRRKVVSIPANGYEWMPIQIGTNTGLWVARPFTHFI